MYRFVGDGQFLYRVRGRMLVLRLVTSFDIQVRWFGHGPEICNNTCVTKTYIYFAGKRVFVEKTTE